MLWIKYEYANRWICRHVKNMLIYFLKNTHKRTEALGVLEDGTGNEKILFFQNHCYIILHRKIFIQSRGMRYDHQ